MQDQIHIRDLETVALVRALAKQTGRTMTGIVREAVEAYVPPSNIPREGRAEALRGALACDRAALAQSGAEDALEIADLYDKNGLPQ